MVLVSVVSRGRKNPHPTIIVKYQQLGWLFEGKTEGTRSNNKTMFSFWTLFHGKCNDGDIQAAQFGPFDQLHNNKNNNNVNIYIYININIFIFFIYIYIFIYLFIFIPISSKKNCYQQGPVIISEIPKK